ncbi:hypothetical protein H0O03_03290 [Candidatus Micrarchaeota archaeon]|nr:hypothetical protein [Candidatus Micrarchaeota archaeon]
MDKKLIVGIVVLVIVIAAAVIVFSPIFETYSDRPDPQQAIWLSVREQAGLRGAMTPQKINVPTDDYFVRKDSILRDSTVLPTEMQFICAQDAEEAGLCGPETMTENSIAFKARQYYFVVCGNPEATGVKYQVAFGLTAATADAACTLR